MLAQPAGGARRRAVGQRVDHLPLLQINHDRPVAAALLPSPVVDADNPCRRVLAAFGHMALEIPQETVLSLCGSPRQVNRRSAGHPPAAWPTNLASSAHRRFVWQKIERPGEAGRRRSAARIVGSDIAIAPTGPSGSLGSPGPAKPADGGSASHVCGLIARRTQDTELAPNPTAETAQRPSRHSAFKTRTPDSSAHFTFVFIALAQRPCSLSIHSTGSHRLRKSQSRAARQPALHAGVQPLEASSRSKLFGPFSRG